LDEESSEAKRPVSLEAAIAALEVKRDAIADRVSNMILGNKDEQVTAALIIQVDVISKQVDTLKALKKSKEPVARASTPVSKKDVPKFQLKAHGVVSFPGEEVFASVEQFLRAFENVMEATDNDVNLVWKKYVPLAVALDFDAWLQTEVMVYVSWSDAKAVFVKTFGNALLKLQARRAVMSIKMKANETVSEYGLRFGRAVSEAG
ncbi:hypothetical protein A0J61_11916, partial [Choanephora cucurbitarum]